VVYAVLDPGVSVKSEQLRSAMQSLIKDKLNPLFKIHAVVKIECLPRTSSNKVMRRVLRDKFLETTSSV
jgi:acetyl-CoA synthetase